MRALFISALMGALFSLSSFSVQATEPSAAAQRWQGRDAFWKSHHPKSSLSIKPFLN